jgi:hypothetical protein
MDGRLHLLQIVHSLAEESRTRMVVHPERKADFRFGNYDVRAAPPRIGRAINRNYRAQEAHPGIAGYQSFRTTLITTETCHEILSKPAVDRGPCGHRVYSPARGADAFVGATRSSEAKNASRQDACEKPRVAAMVTERRPQSLWCGAQRLHLALPEPVSALHVDVSRRFAELPRTPARSDFRQRITQGCLHRSRAPERRPA